jgi:hypothetical protein
MEFHDIFSSNEFCMFGSKVTEVRRMSSSGVLRRVARVRTDFSEEHIAPIIRVKGIIELGTILAVTSNQSTPIFPLDDGSYTLLGNVDSYKSHTA